LNPAVLPALINYFFRSSDTQASFEDEVLARWFSGRGRAVLESDRLR